MNDQFDFDAAVDNALWYLRDMFAEVRRDVHSLCESPIERLLADSLITTSSLIEGRPPVCLHPSDKPEFGPDTPSLLVSPQRKVGPYRADFALWYRSSMKPVRMVVECDGHAFHEKTKEQARRDKARDRYFLSHGWPVMRFTGSEIHASPERCAGEAGSFLFDLWVKANSGVDIYE